MKVAPSSALRAFGGMRLCRRLAHASQKLLILTPRPGMPTNEDAVLCPDDVDAMLYPDDVDAMLCPDDVDAMFCPDDVCAMLWPEAGDAVSGAT